MVKDTRGNESTPAAAYTFFIVLLGFIDWNQIQYIYQHKCSGTFWSAKLLLVNKACIEFLVMHQLYDSAHDQQFNWEIIYQCLFPTSGYKIAFNASVQMFIWVLAMKYVHLEDLEFITCFSCHRTSYKACQQKSYFPYVLNQYKPMQATAYIIKYIHTINRIIKAQL